MATRLRANHQDDKWKYYVYQFYKNGLCVYVGKGSNKRFNVQSLRFKDCTGSIVAYFINEQESLIHENMLILNIASLWIIKA